MVQVRIVLDEEKILKEQHYDLDKMWAAIDDAFLRYDLIKTDIGIFRDSGKDRDYGRLWSIVFALGEIKWFMDNVSEWYWLNTDESGFEEDLLLEMRRVTATA